MSRLLNGTRLGFVRPAFRSDEKSFLGGHPSIIKTHLWRLSSASYAPGFYVLRYLGKPRDLWGVLGSDPLREEVTSQSRKSDQLALCIDSQPITINPPSQASATRELHAIPHISGHIRQEQTTLLATLCQIQSCSDLFPICLKQQCYDIENDAARLFAATTRKHSHTYGAIEY